MNTNTAPILKGNVVADWKGRKMQVFVSAKVDIAEIVVGDIYLVSGVNPKGKRHSVRASVNSQADLIALAHGVVGQYRIASTEVTRVGRYVA